MNAAPHGLSSIIVSVCLTMLLATQALGTEPVLPGTERLTIERPLDEEMIAGLRRFCLRELADSPALRSAQWRPHLTTAADLEQHVASLRDRLGTILGATDPRATQQASPPAEFELVTTLRHPSLITKTAAVAVHRVRWAVLEGVTAEGLLLVPQTVRAGVVALPDADWTPEMLCGLTPGLPDSVQFVRRLAEAGCLVAIPTLLSRSDEYSGQPDVRFTNQPHREFLYRQAFEVGRHVIGYEVQKTLAAVDLLEQHLQQSPSAAQLGSRPIGVAGVGEGGLLALSAAALDPRIRACWVSGYFQQRENVWQEPIYRNVWGLLNTFGDAELAGMIAPRCLVIEAASAVTVSGPPAVRPGRAEVAAPGRIRTCPLDSVHAEFNRAVSFYQLHGQRDRLVLAVSGDKGDATPGSDPAVRAFAEHLQVADHLPAVPLPWQSASQPLVDHEAALKAARVREKQQLDELQAHVQNLLLRSHQVRDARWRMNPADVQGWQQRQPELRKWVHDELIGRLPHARLPLRPRSRLILETNHYVGYEIVIDVFDDVIASGILLIPRDLQEAGKRPVVVCQHGLEGMPLDTISREPRSYAIYKAFSEELVQQGFVVYAPQNPYRGGDRFRELQRMSNPLGRSLFSYIIAQHEQTLDWLSTLPFVDAQRIGFYGISYGGKTAMRVPPLVERYSLAICSGDFTDWPRTLASNHERFSYLFTSEYEVFEWNLAHVASYAELAQLLTPRPFMVEEGHRDGGQPTEWVAGEFGKVRRHYDQSGLSDRAVIEFFDGPHTIHGQGTFRFLHHFLKPPNGH